jgi:hypothetical protein
MLSFNAIGLSVFALPVWLRFIPYEVGFQPFA